MKTSRNKGFTLIELLVVISIIGFLAAIALTSFNSARSKARNAKRLADVRQIMSGLELYYNDNGGYPVQATASTTGPAAQGTPAWSTYLGIWPTAPSPADNPTGSSTCTGTNNLYTYTAPAGGASYTLTFCLGANTGGYAAGVRTASQSGIQ